MMKIRNAVFNVAVAVGLLKPVSARKAIVEGKVTKRIFAANRRISARIATHEQHEHWSFDVGGGA